MIEGIHILLTYDCTLECNHCFLHCGPHAGGTFRLDQICALLDQAIELGTVTSVCFEGGEPVVYYSLLLECVRQARIRDLGVGIVTNAYWATSVEDAELVLRPLHEAGLDHVTMSDDALHYGAEAGKHRLRVEEAANRLGMTVSVISVEAPTVIGATDESPAKVSGSVMFRGRAAERMTAGLPTRPWDTLSSCPRERLDSPGRVHVDCFGSVHLCQGLLMGNLWETPLKQLVAKFDPHADPIVGPILRGGPAALVRAHDLSHSEGYVDECHLCYSARQEMRRQGNQASLGPAQAYGIA
ncbi:MAG: radical SAM protein [Fimbriimonas sp.]|nr:radical SAM protein [Fimbriimonas sp.]